MLDGGTIDSRGGLVFESKDRSVRLDYRFEGVLEDIWNKNMYEIYKRLFG
jgi:vacuolar-type H+-ATPase subunit E/Vma4